MARPTKYTEEITERVYEYARVGLTDRQMAKLLKISLRTLHYWKRKHPEFLHSLQRGKAEFDSEEIEGALRQRALGFSIIEEKIITRFIKNRVKITKVETTRHYPPDVGAIMTWLYRHRPDRWKKNPGVSGPNDKPIVIQIIEEESKL